MQIIPLATVPSQSLNALLGGQYCKINVYAKTTGVFIDVAIKGVAMMSGVICRDRVKLVNREYLGFIGDLAFVDLEGITDPIYTGFGTRYVLVYLEAGDV